MQCQVCQLCYGTLKPVVPGRWYLTLRDRDTIPLTGAITVAYVDMVFSHLALDVVWVYYQGYCIALTLSGEVIEVPGAAVVNESKGIPHE